MTDIQMIRSAFIDRLRDRKNPWDMAVIGGGATGLGIAVDAASRGFDVVILEQSDFGKGTSSRSTKLVHGGVRYLQQGNISLVMEALKERGILLRNAPHLVSDLEFIVPNYSWWEAPFYGLGMKIYDVLAGRYQFGKSRTLGVEETVARLPNIERDGLRGGVSYHDGQFDDARLLVNLAQTACEQGAAVVNYVRVTGLTKDKGGLLSGLSALDEESGESISVPARVIVNATGPFTDAIRQLDVRDARPIIMPSQGVHLTFDRSFLSGDSAIMVPHTRDGRVMFAVPWHHHVIVGTTDTAIDRVTLEPKALDEEIVLIIDTAKKYLEKDPTRADVQSVFTGIRPLVTSGNDDNTAALSRDHTIEISRSGLVTVTGGKWTTYRNMAEDCVNQAITIGDLPDRPCRTLTLPIHGHMKDAHRHGDLKGYGADAPVVEALLQSEPAFSKRLHDDLPYRAGEVVWSARCEMARTVDDYLSRRSRAAFLNIRAALQMAPKVASLMAKELGQDDRWCRDQVDAFNVIAKNYLIQ